MFGLVSQLAHLELESPKPAESVAFLTDVLGLSETARDGNSVYLRAWTESFHHSLVVSEGPAPRIAHVGWRAAGQAQLEEAVRRIEETGLGQGWVEDAVGHGRAYRYLSPGGHRHEIFWEVERYEAPPELRSTYPIRPQRFTPVGAAVRQIDHVTFMTGKINEDVAFYSDVLGSRFMECTVVGRDDETPIFVQLSNTEQAHDVGLVLDQDATAEGRSHHFAYFLELPTDVTRAADVIVESGTPIEHGPGKHGHGENTFLYFREPGGHRIELFSGGYRNYQPDWETRRWAVEDGGAHMFRNFPVPESMLEAFPPNDTLATVTDDGASPWTYAGVS